MRISVLQQYSTSSVAVIRVYTCPMKQPTSAIGTVADSSAQSGPAGELAREQLEVRRDAELVGERPGSRHVVDQLRALQLGDLRHASVPPEQRRELGEVDA